MYPDGPIQWRIGDTARYKRLGIEPPCTGSPRCAGAVHIERLGNNATWSEIHLTDEEIVWAIQQLKAALRIARERTPRPRPWTKWRLK